MEQRGGGEGAPGLGGGLGAPPTSPRRRSRGEAAFHSCPHFMEAAGDGGGVDSGGWVGGLPASCLSEWELVIPDLIPLDGPWSLVRGRLSPTLLPPKQVRGISDLGQTSLGPQLDPALSRPQPTERGSVCCPGFSRMLRRARGFLPTATNAFLKMEPPLAPPSLSGSKSGSLAGWAWLSRRLALARWVSGSQGPD